MPMAPRIRSPRLILGTHHFPDAGACPLGAGACPLGAGACPLGPRRVAGGGGCSVPVAMLRGRPLGPRRVAGGGGCSVPVAMLRGRPLGARRVAGGGGCSVPVAMLRGRPLGPRRVLNAGASRSSPLLDRLDSLLLIPRPIPFISLLTSSLTLAPGVKTLPMTAPTPPEMAPFSTTVSHAFPSVSGLPCTPNSPIAVPVLLPRKPASPAEVTG